MSWFERRRVLAAGLVGLGLASCGFSPAYGPQGGARALTGQVALEAPQGRTDYLLNRRLEDRLGRAGPGAALRLAVTTDLDQDGLAITSDGKTTRYHLTGRATYALRRGDADAVILSDTVSTFAGYSATGSTVATVAAKRDASERLMTMLADRITDRLVAAAPDIAP